MGNVPATYDDQGNLLSVGQGSLTILDRGGNVVTTLSDSLFLDGPWDLTINDQGSSAQVFVSNVLNGLVTRIDLTVPKTGDPTINSITSIGSGYMTRTDPAALVIGPTGLAYNPKNDTLYVASTGDNKIFAIKNASTRTSSGGTGSVVYADNANLRGPLGLALAPNGNLITANGDAVNADPTQPSELIEFTPGGKFVGAFSIDAQQGGAFGVAVTNVGGLLRLAAVEDITNSVDVWSFETDPPAASASAATAVSTATAVAPAPAVASASTATSVATSPQAPPVAPAVMVQAPAPTVAQTSLIAPITTTSTTTTAGTASSKSAKHKSLEHLLHVRAEERHRAEQLSRRLARMHKHEELVARLNHEKNHRDM